jgi:U3 small nucleolar RNA-associated protein 25
VLLQDRFFSDFGDPDAPDDDAGLEAATAKAKDDGAAGAVPAEHQALFAGNTDDHFRLGIKLTRWQSRLHVQVVLCLAAQRCIAHVR